MEGQLCDGPCWHLGCVPAGSLIDTALAWSPGVFQSPCPSKQGLWLLLAGRKGPGVRPSLARDAPGARGVSATSQAFHSAEWREPQTPHCGRAWRSSFHQDTATTPIAGRIFNFKAQQNKCSWRVELCLSLTLSRSLNSRTNDLIMFLLCFSPSPLSGSYKPGIICNSPCLIVLPGHLSEEMPSLFPALQCCQGHRASAGCLHSWLPSLEIQVFPKVIIYWNANWAVHRVN